MKVLALAAVVSILSAAATPARAHMTKACLSALWNYSALVADMAIAQAREGLGSVTIRERYSREFCRFMARTVQECMLVQERYTMEQGGFRLQRLSKAGEAVGLTRCRSWRNAMSDEPNNTDLLQAIHALAARFDGLEQRPDARTAATEINR